MNDVTQFDLGRNLDRYWLRLTLIAWLALVVSQARKPDRVPPPPSTAAAPPRPSADQPTIVEPPGTGDHTQQL